MVLYKGYCRPLGKKVDFNVVDVISMNTKRGIKWRVKGKFEDYNISTFCSSEKAQEILSQLPLKMDAEIAYTPPPNTYEAEELLPSFSNATKKADEIEAEEETIEVHEQIQENTNAHELDLHSEKLPSKYYKKDGSLDMRYTICREFAAKRAESQNAVELEAPYTPIEPERPSDDYGGGGRYRKKPRRPLDAEEKCDICSEGPIYEKDVNIEDYDDPIQVCQSCFDDTFTDIAAESFDAEDMITITGIDWETDGEDIDLPTTMKVPANLEEDEIADYLSDQKGWLVNGFVMGAESFGAERVYDKYQVYVINPDGTEDLYGEYESYQDAEADIESDGELDYYIIEKKLSSSPIHKSGAESFEAAYTPEQRLDDYTPEQLTTSSAVTGDFFEDSLKYSYGGFQAETEELGETSYAEDVPALQRAEAGMEVENIEQAYRKKEDQFMTLIVDDATLFRLAPDLPSFVMVEDSEMAGYTSLKFNFVENPEMEQQILSYAINVVDDKDDEAEEPEFKEGDVRNRLFNVEFDDWAEQEILTHGKDVSFKEWADEESESHSDREFMDWAKHEEESHDERYEAEGAKRRSFKVWGMKEGRKYWQGQFDLQMQDWLEFAWINRDNPQFKTYQGERLTQDGSKNYIGSPKGVKKSNKPTGTKMRNVINTNELYKAWKNQSPIIEATAQKRCLVSYQEAVPEMHIFLDYMEDAGIDIKEAEWRNLSDFEMGDRDRYALGDEIIAISQTLRENKVDDWRAVKKLGRAIKQGTFRRVRDEMGNIGIDSRRGVWDKHHKDFFELFSPPQIQALGIPWVVNDYRAEITDEDLSELESKLDRKIDSYVKGPNYTQCVACDKEAKVEILQDNDGNTLYHLYSCECGHNDIQDSSYDAETFEAPEREIKKRKLCDTCYRQRLIPSASKDGQTTCATCKRRGFDRKAESFEAPSAFDNEDIIAYLKNSHRSIRKYNAPYRYTSRGIANHFGVVRSNISKRMKILKDEGIVSEVKRRVEDSPDEYGTTSPVSVFYLTENKLMQAEESDGFIGRIPKSKSMREKTEILKNNIRIIFEEAQRPLYPREVLTLYEQKKYGNKPQRKSKYKRSPRANKLGISQKKLSQIINAQKGKYYISRRGLIHYIGDESMQDYIKNLDPKYFAEDESNPYNRLPDDKYILKYLEESHRSIRKYNAPYRYSSKGMAHKFGVSPSAMRGRMRRMERAGEVKSTLRRCEDAPKQNMKKPLKIYYLPDKKLMGAENEMEKYK